MSKREPIVSGGIGLIVRAYASVKGTGYRPRFDERGKFPKEDRCKAPELDVDENTKIVARRCAKHGTLAFATDMLIMFLTRKNIFLK